jgi:hypothetical protein
MTDKEKHELRRAELRRQFGTLYDFLSRGYFLLGLFAFGSALIVQLVYGGILYVALKRLDWLNLPIILLAYVAPVIAFSWHASDTTNDIVGTIHGSYLR